MMIILTSRVNDMPHVDEERERDGWKEERRPKYKRGTYCQYNSVSSSRKAATPQPGFAVDTVQDAKFPISFRFDNDSAETERYLVSKSSFVSQIFLYSSIAPCAEYNS